MTTFNPAPGEEDKSANAARPSVQLVRGDMVPLEPLKWLWHGFLPRAMLTLLAGPPGCGKTTIALHLAAVITRGGKWPDGSSCPVVGDVIIWSGEDGHSVLAARLAAMNADMSRIHFVGDVTAAKGVDFDPRTQMDLLEATASKLAAPCLFIIDPIVSAVKGDGNNSPEVRQSLRPVVALGQRLDCAVLGITHFSKGTEDRDPVERVTGSIGFVALARLVLVASKVAAANDMESRNVMVRAKANIGPDDGGFAYTLDRMTVAPDVEGQRVVWGEALIGTARDLLADRTNAGRATNEIDIFINDLLGDGPMLVKTIKEEAKEAGYSWRTVQDRSKRLNVITKKGGMAGGWTWSLGTTPEGARGGAP